MRYNEDCLIITSMADYSLQHVCVSDLGLVLAEVWQSEGRLWVDEIMVDIPLRRHKH